MPAFTAPQESDAMDIRALFEAYPFKAWQQRRQGIAADRLAAMLWETTRPLLRREDHDFFLVRDDGDSGAALGLAGLTPDRWHGEIFGRAMGKIQPLLTYAMSPEAIARLVADLLDQARRRDYRHLSCRVDASDWQAIQALEAAGFYLVDGSQKLARRLGTQPFVSGPEEMGGEGPVGPGGARLGPLRPGEADALARIAVQSHVTNHFFNDPALDRADAVRLFEAWVHKCCNGLAAQVLVARIDDEPVGFVTFLSAGKLREWLDLSLIILDFIIVDQAHQGRGMGQWLLRQALNQVATCFDWVELRTSYNNYPALVLYHRNGFQTLSSDAILHWAG